MRSTLIKNKSIIILVLATIILLTPSFFIQSWIRMDNKYSAVDSEFKDLKESGFWILSSPIHIDNNWSATASTYEWCSGLGTALNPYIIENVTIDAQNSGNCILIENTNDHFKIQNCTLINSQASPNSAIRLDSSSNGKILDNNITNNAGRGINLYDTTNIFIEDNHMVNNGYGITLTYSDGNIVSNNYIQDSGRYGIYIYQSDDNLIIENEVNHNGFYAIEHGIYITEGSVDSTNNTIKHNYIHNNRLSGIRINSCDDNKIFGNIIENNVQNAISLDDSDDISIIGNVIHGSIVILSSLNTIQEWNALDYVLDPFIIDELGSGNFTWEEVSQFAWCSGDGSYNNPYRIASVVIDAQSAGSCIRIKNSYSKYFIIDGCLLMNAEASGNDAGIKLDWVHNGTILNCDITENYVGIYLSHSENVTIKGTSLDDNGGQGIVLYQSKNNKIIDNEQSGSLYYGLFLNAGSDNNLVSGNYFQDNTGEPTYGDGIRILDSESNNVTDNFLIYNDKGIYIRDNSNYNRIINNTIHDNTVYGALVVANTRESHDNYFYLNSFDNPSTQNAFDNGTATIWDNDTIGNYWSDYGGVDANDDGRGDSEYFIPGIDAGVDHFPIWDDGDDIAPIIIIISPLNNSKYSTTAPTYSITITELNLDTYYYVISGPSVYKIQIIYSLSGSVDQSIWNALPAGTYNFTVYVNDTAGNLASASVTVIKENLPDTTPAIPFGNFYLIVGALSIAFLLISVKYKRKKII